MADVQTLEEKPEHHSNVGKVILKTVNKRKPDQFVGRCGDEVRCCSP